MATTTQKVGSLSKIVGRNVVSIRRLLHDGPNTLEELLDGHVAKREKSLDDDEEELLARQRLLTTQREALSLYRDIIRGIVWRDILRELEEARFEKDPETVNRLLIGGRDAVQSTLEKLAEKHRQQIEKESCGGGGNRR